jgi:hypothetical protein
LATATKTSAPVGPPHATEDHEALSFAEVRVFQLIPSVDVITVDP